MSKDNIKYLSDKQRKENGGSINNAIKRAQQHVRNVGAR